MTRLSLLLPAALLLATACDDRDCQFAQYDLAPESGQINPTTGQCEYFGGEYYDECGGLAYAEADLVYRNWPQCFSECTGLDESTCKTTSGCQAAYLADCAEGQRCDPAAATEFYECWDVAEASNLTSECSDLGADECATRDDCEKVHYENLGSFAVCRDEDGGGGNGNVGQCYGEASCDEPPPDCPDGTLPGLDYDGGCWTRYCIPVNECESAACSDLGVEEQCLSRSDCTPLYEGQGCTCDGIECTCTSHLFQSCS